jgi:hypothetical protein
VNAWPYDLGIPLGKKDSKVNSDIIAIITNGIIITQDDDLWKDLVFIEYINILCIITVFDFFLFYSTTIETLAKNNKEFH